MKCSLLSLLRALSRLYVREEGRRQRGWKAIAITDIKTTSKSPSGALSIVFQANQIMHGLHATHF